MVRNEKIEKAIIESSLLKLSDKEKTRNVIDYEFIRTSEWF